MNLFSSKYLSSIKGSIWELETNLDLQKHHFRIKSRVPSKVRSGLDKLCEAASNCYSQQRILAATKQLEERLFPSVCLSVCL